MNRQHDNLKTIIHRRRQQVLALVVLWLVSWMMLVMEPCCEVVAASLPHQHATAAEHSHPSAAVTPHTTGHGHSTGGHDDQHCQTLEAPSGDAPFLPLAGDTKSTTDSPHGIVPPISHTQAVAAVAHTTYENHVRRYAPSGRTLFLRTERLRI